MAVDRLFAGAGLLHSITYEGNDTATMIEFIRNGLAIGLLAPSLVDTTEDITFVPICDHPPEFQTAVGFAVGYDSPSQFSREYRRMFGVPPSPRRAGAPRRHWRPVDLDAELVRDMRLCLRPRSPGPSGGDVLSVPSEAFAG